MAKLGSFVTFFYFLAFVAGVISLFLPFWVTTKVDVETRTVTVTRRIQSGLWWKRESYEIKADSLYANETDASWKSISSSNMDTDGIKAIKGVIIIGLGFLLVVIFIAGCTRCCANDGNQFRMYSVFCGAGVAAIIAGILIGIGPIIYYTDVKDDYKYKSDDLDWCFWTAVASACAAIAAGILGILGCLVSFRGARKKSITE